MWRRPNRPEGKETEGRKQKEEKGTEGRKHRGKGRKQREGTHTHAVLKMQCGGLCGAI